MPIDRDRLTCVVCRSGVIGGQFPVAPPPHYRIRALITGLRSRQFLTR